MLIRETQTGISCLLEQKFIFFGGVDASAKLHRAHPVIVAPQVSGCIVTGSIVHCWWERKSIREYLYNVDPRHLFAQKYVNSLECFSKVTFVWNSEMLNLSKATANVKECSSGWMKQKIYHSQIIRNWAHWVSATHLNEHSMQIMLQVFNGITECCAKLKKVSSFVWKIEKPSTRSTL